MRLGHGCYLVSKRGYSYSHSHISQDFERQNGFMFSEGDVIRVIIYNERLIITNETRGLTCTLDLEMTAEEWNQARFCVELTHYQD
jgi:hypothetical protein